MIRKIKIVEKPKSEIEKLLESVNPNWEGDELFNWNYMFDYPQQITPMGIYDLTDFEKQTPESTTTFYNKGKQFVLELIKGNMVRVLTNINPKEEYKSQEEINREIRQHLHERLGI